VVVVGRPTIALNSNYFTFDNCSCDLDAGSPTSYILTITNSGPTDSILQCSLVKRHTSPWLSISPTWTGDIGSGESVDVTVSLNTSFLPQTCGTFSEIVDIVSSNATNSPQTVAVSINVS
jgi:hypothetical protein